MPIPTKTLIYDPPATEAPAGAAVMEGKPDTSIAPLVEVGLFERLARDESVPVEKLEKLIELQERIIAHQAKAAFDAAFAEMQGEIPIISERGEIWVKEELRSRFARLEDILEVATPIMQRHGFGLRFRAGEPSAPGKIKRIGILTHRAGHSEQDEFECKADDSGGKNDVQSIGSTRSYAQRYITISLLNIVTRGQDDDGQKSERKPPPPAPAGYDSWLTDFTAVADEGARALRDAWNKTKQEYRAHITKTAPTTLARLRTKADGVKVGGQ